MLNDGASQRIDTRSWEDLVAWVIYVDDVWRVSGGFLDHLYVDDRL